MDSRSTPVGFSRRRFLAVTGAGVLAGPNAVRALVDGPSNQVVSTSSTTVVSPHGPAEVRFDAYGAPHVSAEDELSLYYAVGYVQASERGFQLDAKRRQFRGELAAAFGPEFADSDVFHRQMDFAAAAAATWAHLEDTDVGPLLRAFAEGVNRVFVDGPLPMEFGLVPYQPAPWTPADTVLLAKQFGWSQNGSFETLRRSVVADGLGDEVAAELYPATHDHDAPVLRWAGSGPSALAGPPSAGGAPDAPSVDQGLVSWLSGFERPPGVGSNSWVVSGEHTASGRPMVAGDPHFPLSAPTQFYELALETPAYAVRGVTVPGLPFVVYGENDAGAWTFTNAYGDAIDFYGYEVDGDRYRYRGEWRRFDDRTEAVVVKGAPERRVTVRKTVHGPLLHREGQTVGVAWTGLAVTETLVALHALGRSAGAAEFVDACRRFDQPVMNFLYADREGNTRFQHVGRVPIRTVDGARVPGTRVFDGSAGEGEWAGFTPYGRSSWDGFWAFEDQPSEADRSVHVAANQRLGTEDDHLLAERFLDPYRAIRIQELLEERIASGRAVDVAFTKRVQLDVVDLLARELVPPLVEAARAEPDLGDAAALLDGWDYRMQRGSRAALLFVAWVPRYHAAVFADRFEAAGLEDVFAPRDWVLSHLERDSHWFTDRSRADLMTHALWEADQEVGPDDTLADRNTTGPVEHRFEHPLFDYPTVAVDGSIRTVAAFDPESLNASSWRFIAPLDGSPFTSLAGGNDGSPRGGHYSDQLAPWAAGEYRRFGPTDAGAPDLAFGTSTAIATPEPGGPTVTPTTGAGGAPTATAGVDGGVTATPGQPGFGLAAALAGVALSYAVARRRRGPE